MTTQEAKTKQCPMIQMRCVAENCMAWQPHEYIPGSGYCAQFSIQAQIFESILKKKAVS